jgi:LPXTG-motif cell wall-anchored protein
MIATIVSWFAFAGAAIVLAALLYGLRRPERS